MTITEMREQLERARDAAPDALRAGKRAAAEKAAASVAADWPRDSGDSADAWVGDEDGVRNDKPYVSFVHDGLADRLVPDALRAAEAEFANVVEARIDAAAGWK